jgi:hypothetical protein
LPTPVHSVVNITAITVGIKWHGKCVVFIFCCLLVFLTRSAVLQVLYSLVCLHVRMCARALEAMTEVLLY